MSNKKQTIFNFRMARNPELLSESAKSLYYVNHPNVLNPANPPGDFITAINGMGVNDDKRTVLQNTANAFAVTLNIDNTISTASGSYNELYDFGIYLLNNRGKHTIANLDSEIASITQTISAPNKTIIWDHIFYLIIEQSDPYLLEGLTLVLIAEHFINNYNSSGTADEANTLANCELSLPQLVFKLDDEYRTASTENDVGPNIYILERHWTAMKSSITRKWAKIAKGKLLKYRKAYEKTKKTAEDAAISAYRTSLETYKSTFNITAVADKYNPTITYDKYTSTENDYNPPSYSFSPDPEIDGTAMSSSSVFTTDTDSYHFLDSIGVVDTDSFEEAIVAIDENITVIENEGFENTDFNVENIEINGTAIPTCREINHYGRNYPYFIKAIQRNTDKYAIIITVDIRSECTSLREIDIDLDNPASNTFTKFKAVNNDGIISIHITQGNMATISAFPIELSGTLKFDNGLILSFTDDLELEGTTGFMTDSNAQTGNTDLFIPSGFGLKQLGIEEYKRVQQFLCCYKPGEVSHIENVMAREYKERSTRRLRSAETSTTSSYESESEHLTDSSSTSRFDMQKEVSETLSESKDIGLSAGLSFGFSSPGGGGFSSSLNANANYATNSSKESANREAINVAKEVTQKTLERVISKVSEQRTSKIIEEFEENNRHGFDNRLGDNHVSGVYRWVDAEYEVEVQNFGKRLMYEFMIPEPAAFHITSNSKSVKKSNYKTIVKPLDPRKPNFGAMPPLSAPDVLTDTNYQYWASAYGAEVFSPPAEMKVIGKTFVKQESSTDSWNVPQAFKEDLPLPEGYGFKKAFVSSDSSYGGRTDARILVSIGDNTNVYRDDPLIKRLFDHGPYKNNLFFQDDTIPVGVEFFKCEGGIINISIELERKESFYKQWQLETFNAIIEAYEIKNAEFEEKNAELQSAEKATLASTKYREIENILLKKNCISYLIGHTNMGKNFVKGSKPADSHVVISQAMDNYAASVKFFEQAFEWNIMSYNFYPFYWAGKNEWSRLYSITSNDSQFESFLKAGMARVVVSVRPGFEHAVMHYMATGQIWNGKRAPIIGDNLYLSISEELKEQEYTVDETWKIRIPTTLTILQKGVFSLDAPGGLPCYCDGGTEPTETFDQTTDGSINMKSHIDGYTAPEPLA
jgi:hypothetical protein